MDYVSRLRPGTRIHSADWQGCSGIAVSLNGEAYFTASASLFEAVGDKVYNQGDLVGDVAIIQDRRSHACGYDTALVRPKVGGGYENTIGNKDYDLLRLTSVATHPPRLGTEVVAADSESQVRFGVVKSISIRAGETVYFICEFEPEHQRSMNGHCGTPIVDAKTGEVYGHLGSKVPNAPDEWLCANLKVAINSEELSLSKYTRLSIQSSTANKMLYKGDLTL